MTIQVQTLIIVETAAKILEGGLAIAKAMGLPVTTWRTGDPTRSLYKYLATTLASLEGVNAEFIKAGFLSTAEGEWLTVLAWEVYGVPRVEATYADPTVSIVNNGGGNFTFEPGEAIFANSLTDKTYHNNNTVTFSGLGATATFELEADEAGSDSTAGLNEIDLIITSMLGVAITGSTVGIATDEQSDEALKEQCRASLGALSPNGPHDAYEYVARNSTLTGQTGVTRAKSLGSPTGAVTVYIAGPSGPVDGAAVTAVQDAVERWSTPLTANPTVISAAAFNTAATVTISKKPALTQTDDEIESEIESAIVTTFAEVPIGGTDTTVADSILQTAIHNRFPDLLYSVDVEFTPALVLASDEVPVLTTLTVVQS
jgi:phage-related baseplate assembly protein